MVAVRVRDEDGVGARDVADRRDDAANVAEALAQQRIGEQRDAVELDQGRGVSDIGQAAHPTSLSAAARPVRGARARRPGHAGLRTRGRHAPLDGTPPRREAYRMRTAARVERVRERALELAPRAPGYDYAMVVFSRDRRHGGGLLAGALAFRLFGAMLPLALLVAVLLGYAATVDDTAAEQAGEATGISEAVLESVAESSKLTAGTRWVVGVTALVALVWAAMSAARAIRAVHSIAWRGSVGRFRRPLPAAFALLGVLAACALIFGVAGRARAESGALGLVVTLAALVGFFAVWLGAELLLPHEDAPWRALVPGAALFAIGVQVVHLATALFIAGRVERASETYGSLGVAFTLLFWLYVVSRVIVASAMLNAALWEQPRRARSRPGTSARL